MLLASLIRGVSQTMIVLAIAFTVSGNLVAREAKAQSYSSHRGLEEFAGGAVPDTLKLKDSSSTVVGTMTLQFLGGEATMAAFFFALGGNGFLYEHTTEEQAYLGAWAWWAGIFASAGSVDIIGNLMHARDGSYWHTLVGGAVGLALVPIFSYDTNSAFHRSPVLKYITLSTLPVLGEVAAYYLWPASSDPTQDSGRFQVAPSLSNNGGSLHLIYRF